MSELTIQASFVSQQISDVVPIEIRQGTIALAFFIFVVIKQPPVDERIKKVLDYLEENFEDSGDLKRLAGIAFLSPYHFHRLFKKETGIALRKFIELHRLEKGYQVLLNGDTNVRDLALTLGYKNYETFSRAFKKHYQVAPDIIKSIALKVLEQSGASGGKVRLFLVNTDDLDTANADISEKLLEKLVREKFELTGNDVIKTFILEPKKAGGKSSEDTIKNKYELKEENKIWENILQKLDKPLK